MVDHVVPTAIPEFSASVVVAMLTYRRTGQLPAAVDAVLMAAAEVDPAPSVLIVDNDPAGEAMPLAQRWSSDRVRFVHEPTPGIAAARNRALDELGDCRLIVFIDDDERPARGWLPALLTTWKRTGAAAVVGPVVSTFTHEPGPWIVQGGYFERRRLPTETPISVAATNNLLLDADQVRDAGVRFETRFGTTGGSDSLFTRQLHGRGKRLVWCDEAVVYDLVPAERLTRHWVLQRALRMGNSSSQVALALEPRLGGRTRQRLLWSVRGTVRIAVGGLRAFYGVVTGSVRHRARGARTLARGLGMVGGAWGYVYAEYRRRPRRERWSAHLPWLTY